MFNGKKTYLAAGMLAGLAVAAHFYPEHGDLWMQLNGLAMACGLAGLRMAIPPKPAAVNVPPVETTP
jgi:hypothetical protein